MISFGSPTGGDVLTKEDNMLGAAMLMLAQAAPSPLIYLECTIIQAGKSNEWKITLNEANGLVDYDSPISGPQRRPARFTADSVSFIGFTLSRTDLSIVRRANGQTETGTCRLAQPKARAF
ncbi:hemagglutinin hemolysin-related protein [Aphanothece sacrum FPU3]|nr:hypothetical protein [Aphanothece sacrum]GBF86491.1 hemagglutinin hemolysin-related protein [Aphanothece sacrum FPU3]